MLRLFRSSVLNLTCREKLGVEGSGTNPLMARVLEFCADAKMSGSFGIDRVLLSGRGRQMHI